MPADGIGNGSWGVAFLVAATWMADAIAKACSSPQTAHINARSRATTLMLWVHIGLVEGAIFVAVALAVDKKYRMPILLGAVAEGTITWLEYVYAMQAGLRSAEPGTET
jgi:hypothetical protein